MSAHQSARIYKFIALAKNISLFKDYALKFIAREQHKINTAMWQIECNIVRQNKPNKTLEINTYFNIEEMLVDFQSKMV
jgi:hypothetical protein